jgi:hypothetical protein
LVCFGSTHTLDGDITSFEGFNRATDQWVDHADLGAYVYKGEPGATRITEAEAASSSGSSSPRRAR